MKGFNPTACLRLSLLMVVILLAGCGPTEANEVRIGFLPNLTHSVPMIGDARGMYDGISTKPVRLVPFNAGPAAVEAMLAGDIDYVYCGPTPAINAFVRTQGRVRVIAGAAAGGAAFVIRDEMVVDDLSALRRARLASPQIGNTQDVALRQFLIDNDLASRDRGGSVLVVPMSNPDILSMMRLKELDGAWVPEPWVTRLVDEAGGRVLVNETSLWPEGKFPTTVLIARDSVLKERPEEALTLRVANSRVIGWINANHDEARRLANAALEKHAGKKLKDTTLRSAWKNLVFTDDPLVAGLRENARSARRIGYLPTSDIRGILAELGPVPPPKVAPAPAAAAPVPAAKRKKK